MCEQHHSQEKIDTEDCGGVNCPLGIKHPPAGEVFAIGCMICNRDLSKTNIGREVPFNFENSRKNTNQLVDEEEKKEPKA